MADHSVQVAVSGAQGLEAIDPGDLPDVVLADVMMPGMDGIETLRRIRLAHPALPVILVTGQQLAPELQREADALVPKPINFDLLLEAIDRLATGDFHPDP